MACYHPVRAFRLADGTVSFSERGEVVNELSLPCYTCDGCRLERSRAWAVRCMHEAKLYEENCFITLTYNDSHLPFDLGLHYRDFQLFMKRLRKRFKGRLIRFYMCGEYGEQYGRPHFHSCLFNVNFRDRVLFKRSGSGSNIYTSSLLSSLWSDKQGEIGFASVGDCTFESAAYVARYVMKKQFGNVTGGVYQVIDYDTGEVFERNKEFCHMSLKPGIGYGFYKRYFSDIFPRDYCVVRGKQVKVPKYYLDKLDKEDHSMFNTVGMKREFKAFESRADNTPDRLLVKEKVVQARLSMLRRSL